MMTLTIELGVFFLVSALLLFLCLRTHLKIKIFALTFLSISFLIYAYIGSFIPLQDFLIAKEQQYKAQQMLKTMHATPALLIEKLREKLKKEPNRAKGWYLLGRLLASQGRWLEAEKAYQHAFSLSSTNQMIIINYAQSVWENNQQRFTTKSRDLFKYVLKLNPQQVDALAMLAMDAYQQNQYKMALFYWQRLLKLIPENTDDARAIRKAISQTKHKLLLNI